MKREPIKEDVDARHAQAEEAEYERHDDRNRKLALRVKPSGAKSWTLRYRHNGRQRRMTLGRYPDLSLKAARLLARQNAARLALNQDPAAERDARREIPKMLDLLGSPRLPPEERKRGKKRAVEGWYLVVYVKKAGKRGHVRTKKAKAPKSVETDDYYIDKHLRSKRFLHKSVADVTPKDLERIENGCTDGAWRKVRNILRIVFRHAVEGGWVAKAKNPVSKTTATPDLRVERIVSPEERKLVEDALRHAEQLGQWDAGRISTHVCNIIRAAGLTGMRLGELLALQWSEVDTDGGVIRLQDSKTGAKTVPITPHAAAFFEGLPRTEDTHVFTTRAGTRVGASTVQRAWGNLRKQLGLVGPNHMRLHDWRHGWASTAYAAGIDIVAIAKVLGHRNLNTTRRYTHINDATMRAKLEIVGNAIEEARTGG